MAVQMYIVNEKCLDGSVRRIGCFDWTPKKEEHALAPVRYAATRYQIDPRRIRLVRWEECSFEEKQDAIFREHGEQASVVCARILKSVAEQFPLLPEGQQHFLERRVGKVTGVLQEKTLALAKSYGVSHAQIVVLLAEQLLIEGGL